MGFPLADLVIESILRDGFANARQDPEVIEDVFSSLTRPYATAKYGEGEVQKIIEIIKKPISIVHAFYPTDAKFPCVSINLASDQEDLQNAYMQDHRGTEDFTYTDPDKLAGVVVVDNITPDAYDPLTGAISLPDSVNLSAVHVNLLFVDATGAEFLILGGIVNTLGSKQIVVETGATIDLSAGATINSSIDFDRYNQNITTEKFEVILGIHTQEPLLTKYLYVLIKYFLLSRKQDMCTRGVFLGTYSGSDFSRNMDYGSDQIFTRFLHLSGKIQPTWRQDKIVLIDNIDINVKVPKDKYGNDILGLEDSTVSVTDD